MILDFTIAQLRRYCPPLEGRIAGAADFTRGLQNYNANLRLPAAYVVPLAQDSDGNQVMTGLIQVVRKVIAVIVEFEATADRRGQTPAMGYDAMETALFKALLNWPPETCRTLNGQGFQFSGGRFLDLDRARLFYQWEFALDWQLTDADGWQWPAEPIHRIEVDIHRAPLGDPIGDPAARVVIDGWDEDGDEEEP